jgi:mRNA-degrading endonuclease YafQ of YafQ-DinJ toxin-antitoxin module
MDKNYKIIAQGDKQSIIDLKEAIEELIRNNDTLDFVNKYHELIMNLAEEITTI